MKWWDQIWLNEGFATLFEYLLVDNVYPELRMMDYFNVQKVQNTLLVDALETTRAMLTNADTPSGISSLFDRVAYDKCKWLKFEMKDPTIRVNLLLSWKRHSHVPKRRGRDNFPRSLESIFDNQVSTYIHRL